MEKVSNWVFSLLKVPNLLLLNAKWGFQYSKYRGEIGRFVWEWRRGHFLGGGFIIDECVANLAREGVIRWRWEAHI